MPRVVPPNHRCIPLCEWPPLDQAAWNDAITPGSILAGAGGAAHWSSKTRRTVISAYGRWLAFLTRLGQMDPICDPASRVTEEHLRAYIDVLSEQVQSVTLRNRIRDLTEAIRVMQPDADLRLLRRAAQRLNTRARPSRIKGSVMVGPAELVALGQKIMVDAKTQPVRNAIWRATRFRTGLMMALLATRGWRRGNFVALRLGVDVQVLEQGIMFYLGKRDTKNRRPHTVPCPSALEPFLREYLDVYRPMLLKRRQSDRLWITHMGTPLTEDGLYGELTKTTRRELGVAINPHAYRDSLATYLVLQDQANVRHAAALLGHNVNITNRHYNQAPAQAAYAYYHSILGLYLDSDIEKET